METLNCLLQSAGEGLGPGWARLLHPERGRVVESPGGLPFHALLHPGCSVSAGWHEWECTPQLAA